MKKSAVTSSLSNQLSQDISAGERAKSMLDLSNPCLEWTKIAEGMGVKASRATTIEEFETQFKEAMGTKGPRLIEVVL